MGTRGPLPTGNAVRRNRPPDKLQLPVEGYTGPVPDWPFAEATEAELRRWDDLWQRPQACVWARSGSEFTIARYVRLSLAVEHDISIGNVGTAQTLGQVTALEDKLGLTPYAMLRLGWEIVTPDLEAVDPKPVSRGRKLRAVESA